MKNKLRDRLDEMEARLREHKYQLKVLKGVQETKSGRRGVGEIAGATELLGIVDRHVLKAQEIMLRHGVKGSFHEWAVSSAAHTAMMELRKDVIDTFGQRSDLSNVKVLAPAGEKTPTTKTNV